MVNYCIMTCVYHTIFHSFFITEYFISSKIFNNIVSGNRYAKVNHGHCVYSTLLILLFFLSLKTFFSTLSCSLSSTGTTYLLLTFCPILLTNFTFSLQRFNRNICGNTRLMPLGHYCVYCTLLILLPIPFSIVTVSLFLAFSVYFFPFFLASQCF